MDSSAAVVPRQEDAVLAFVLVGPAAGVACNVSPYMKEPADVGGRSTAVLDYQQGRDQRNAAIVLR